MSPEINFGPYTFFIFVYEFIRCFRTNINFKTERSGMTALMQVGFKTTCIHNDHSN